MEPPNWDRIQELYYSALPIAPPDRADFVARACGFDPALTQEVVSLLAADASLADFLEPPIFRVGLKIISSHDGADSGGAALKSVDELIGSTVDGRYLVEKKLGHGGMGAVYLARDLMLHNKPVVLKILLQASLQDPYVVKKFRQEVEALARIDHPGVVTVLGAGELKNAMPYIVMQFVNGVTLRSQMVSEGMNCEKVAAILTQVGAALDAAHETGIFHRDLKPENIMIQALKGSDFVKIVDFGIAKVKDSVIAPSTADQSPIGTVLYMSPEQLRGEKVTAVSDVFSMGVIAYEMVTGRRPFNPTSSAQLIDMHRAGVRVRAVDLRPDLSTEAQAIILRALSLEPQDRYQSAGDFGESLGKALTSAIEPAPRRDADQKFSDEGPQAANLAAFKPTLHDGFDMQAVVTSRDPSTSAPQGSLWKRRKLAIVVGSLFVLLSLAILIGVYRFRGWSPASTQPPQQRAFAYWLTVQKTRGGKNHEDPYLASGQEIFETGYKFRFNFFSAESGYLYIFNEGPPDEDGTRLTLLYPTPLRKNAFVSNQAVNTNWNTFRGQAGTENLWIVWSASSITQFEAVKAEAFDNPKGAVIDAGSVRGIKEFLTQHSHPNPDSTKDVASQQTHVRGVGAVIVKLARLEHR